MVCGNSGRGVDLEVTYGQNLTGKRLHAPPFGSILDLRSEGRPLPLSWIEGAKCKMQPVAGSDIGRLPQLTSC